MRLVLAAVTVLLALHVGPALAQGTSSLGHGLEVEGDGRGHLRVTRGSGLFVHPDFRPVGPVLIADDDAGLVRLSTRWPEEPTEGVLVLAVESRGHPLRLPTGASIGVISPREETLAVWLIPVVEHDGRAVADAIALHPRHRMRFGFVPSELAPSADRTVAVGRQEVAVGRPEGSLLIELANRTRVVLPPPESAFVPRTVRLRAVRAHPADLPRGQRRAAAPVELSGLSRLGDGGVLSVPVRPHAGRRVIAALERVVDRGPCSVSHGTGGCAVQLEPEGHRVLDARLTEGRAELHLDAEALADRAHGRRIVFAWAR